jgi:hypothetical protein
MAGGDDSIYLDVLQVLRGLSDEVRALQQAFSDHRAGVDATNAALRNDMHKANISLQLDVAQHKDEHIVERQERLVDQEQRGRRQADVDGQLQRIQDGQTAIRKWQWVRLLAEMIFVVFLVICVVVAVMLVLFGKVHLL